VGALALAAAGCGGQQAQELSVRDIVARTTEETAAVKSFHFVFRVENPPEGSPGLNLTFARGDLRVPDELDAEVAGTLSGFPLKSRLIFLHGTHYLKNPLGGGWEKYAANISPVAFFDPAKGVLAVIKSAVRLRKTGSEEVSGTLAYRLAGKVPVSAATALLGNPPGPRLVDLELWVGKADLVLRRIRVEGPVAPGESRNIRRTVTISDLDETVKIEPPKVSG
jgi:hypothetical protein